ncbi:MAG: hypothetical protein JO320_01280 [Alphaproteobacteria bacterium]|nr:hypothetical protein [Alphaproteobacteria bacterium]
MDRSDFRPTARELLERHLSEKAPEQEPTRPDITQYPGRLQRNGDMVSENRAAHYYNTQVNREWFNHQRHVDERNRARADLDQHIKNTGRAPVDREDLKRQFNETALEVTGKNSGPSRGGPNDRSGGGDRERGTHPDGPDRPPPGAASARVPIPPRGPDRSPPAVAGEAGRQSSREALNQHIERSENSNRMQMREAARENLRRHLENPDRGQARDQNQNINRSQELER